MGDELAFPLTPWGRVLTAGASDGVARRRALEQLARLGLRPIQWHVRSRWAKTDQQAFELTQGFLWNLLDGGLPAPAGEPRFRVWLKANLGSYLRSQRTAETPGARTGDLAFVPLNSEPPSWAAAASFDELFACCLLEDAATDLEARLAAADLDAFRAAYVDHPSAPLAELATTLGVDEGALGRSLGRCRAELASLVRVRLRATLASDDDLDGELGLLLERTLEEATG
ncbi:MAG: hypothetical protein P1V81_02815 [Planctomycetota bacterium]|nr:hypothetical protein [Planctomycetota bacterium]